MAETISKHDFMMGLVDLGASAEVIAYVKNYATDEALEEAQKAYEESLNVKASIVSEVNGFTFNHEEENFYDAIGLEYDEVNKASKMTTKIDNRLKAIIENSEAYKSFMSNLKAALRSSKKTTDLITALSDSDLLGIFQKELYEEVKLDQPSLQVEFIHNLYQELNVTYEHFILQYICKTDGHTRLDEILKDALFALLKEEL